MKKIIISVIFMIFGMTGVMAFYGIPYNSYSYHTNYPCYNGNYYGGYSYYPYRNNIRRHPIKDKRQLKYLKEYYSAINGYSDEKTNTYQNGNKVVNVNISM